MSEEGGAGSTRRKRKRVATRAQGAPQRVERSETHAESRSTTPPADVAPSVAEPSTPSRPKRGRDSGGGMRDLVGAGPSHLGVGGALRGRDVNRPTDDDLAEAERDVVIVRRNWRPDAAR